jgi:hypothetical protein
MDTQLGHRLSCFGHARSGRADERDIDKRPGGARQRWARQVSWGEPPCAVKAENHILAGHNGVLVHENPLANFRVPRARQWSQAVANRAMDARQLPEACRQGSFVEVSLRE